MLTRARPHGSCNLECHLNLYDSTNGAGQCDTFLADGAITCDGDFAAGGQYAGLCVALPARFKRHVFATDGVVLPAQL